MIKDFVETAIKELDKTRGRCSSIFIDKQMDEVEKAVREAAAAITSFRPLSIIVNRGKTYQTFLYDALKYEFSEEAFENLKVQARGLSTWFGSQQAWRVEEWLYSIGDDKFLWTQPEHLACLVRAYNCAVKDIDVLAFLEQAKTITDVCGGNNS